MFTIPIPLICFTSLLDLKQGPDVLTNLSEHRVVTKLTFWKVKRVIGMIKVDIACTLIEISYKE